MQTKKTKKTEDKAPGGDGSHACPWWRRRRAGGCSLADAGRVGELGEVSPLVHVKRAQAVICRVSGGGLGRRAFRGPSTRPDSRGGGRGREPQEGLQAETPAAEVSMTSSLTETLWSYPGSEVSELLTQPPRHPTSSRLSSPPLPHLSPPRGLPRLPLPSSFPGHHSDPQTLHMQPKVFLMQPCSSSQSLPQPL